MQSRKWLVTIWGGDRHPVSATFRDGQQALRWAWDAMPSPAVTEVVVACIARDEWLMVERFRRSSQGRWQDAMRPEEAE